MKKRYYVFSDVHSCYDALIDSLNLTDFDFDNENHILVGLGDYFDRGTQVKEVYEWLVETKQRLGERFVMIIGNHDVMLLGALKWKLLKTKSPTSRIDYQNLICHHLNDKGNYTHQFFKDDSMEKYNFFMENHVIFYETKNYFFSHMEFIDHEGHEIFRNSPLKLKSLSEFGKRFWVEPLSEIERSRNDKIGVFGHWYAGLIRKYSIGDEKQYKENEVINNAPYFYENNWYIDSRSHITHKVNVLILEDEEL